jgi:hypothetical protein
MGVGNPLMEETISHGESSRALSLVEECPSDVEERPSSPVLRR